MKVDETMSNNGVPLDVENGGFEATYFYRVTSASSATVFNPVSSGSLNVFRAGCEFVASHLSRECIEEHVQLLDMKASPFISVFSDFAGALKQAYFLQLRGHEAIQIIQIDASDLIRTAQISTGNTQSSLIPAWQSTRSCEDQWICLTEIGPLLDVNPRLIHRSEWLACGSILNYRYLASWPIIDDKLFFEEGKGQDLMELFAYVCGHPPDYVSQHHDSGRYEYDWDIGAFVETDAWMAQHASGYQKAVSGAGVGLGLVASTFARPGMFGYAGFLRGMRVID